jgi:hypothetical protein
MRRKIAISLGILLTILYPTVFFLFGKQSVKITGWSLDYYEVKSKKWNCKDTSLLFDKEGKLYEVEFDLPYEGEFLGFRQDDNPEKVIAKWGKPSEVEEYATRGYKDEVDRYKYLIYKRDGGEIQFEFASYGFKEGHPYELKTISFDKVNPPLPKGIKMGMSREEVMRILGKPDSSSDFKDVLIMPFLFALSYLIGSFWTAFLVDFLPRGRKRAHKIFLFLMSSFIALIIFACCRFSLLNFEQLLKGGGFSKIFSFFPPEEDIYAKFIFPFLGFFLIPSLLMGGLFTWLEYGPKKKPILHISVIVLLSILFAFFLTFPTRLYTVSFYPLPFKTALFLAFKSVLLPMLRIASYPLLLAIWFSSLRSNQSET